MSLGQDALVRWPAPDGPWAEPDLHLFPQDGHRYEIIDGCLHVSPPVDDTHEAIAAALVATLRAAAPHGWWACARPGVQIGTSNVVPDVAVLRPGSSGATWADPRDIALVAEVEGPSTRRFDRLLKPALYAEGGVASYWRIEQHGGRAQAHLYRLGPDGYELDQTVPDGQQVTVEQPFPVLVTPAVWLR